MRVICRSAPDNCWACIGKAGELETRPVPQLGYVFRMDGGHTFEVTSILSWSFVQEEAPSKDPIVEAARELPEHAGDVPHDRRDRDKYDSNRFAEDLEEALGALHSHVIEARRASPTQPHLPEGISMQEAMARVCETLVLRKLFETVEFDSWLEKVRDDARVMLLHKNAAYGDSVLNPVRVFSKASLSEQLLVRLDDKVSRLRRGSAAGEDVAGDTLGYLILVLIAEKREREAK